MSFAVFQQLAPTALVDRLVLNGKHRAVCHAVCPKHPAGKDFEVLRQHSLLLLPAPMSTIWCKCSVKTACEKDFKDTFTKRSLHISEVLIRGDRLEIYHLHRRLNRPEYWRTANTSITSN